MNSAVSPPREVTIAATQMSCGRDNADEAEAVARKAAEQGAQVVVLQELFASTYFPIEQENCFALAEVIGAKDGIVARFQKLAKELAVVMPISFFERDGYVTSTPALANVVMHTPQKSF
jgi:N-carbamoylputrescine amidase